MIPPAAFLPLLLLVATTPSVPPAAPPATRTPVPRHAASTPVPTPASRSIAGEILAVDAEKRTLVVRESFRSTRGGSSQRKREVVTLAVDAGTRIEKSRQPVPLESLRIGDHVSARYVPAPAGPSGAAPGAPPPARALVVRVADVPAVRTPTPSPIPESPVERKQGR